jgi:hypothetical protein
MTYAEAKAAGAKIMGTPSYIPKEEWEEMSIIRLYQIKADIEAKLPAVRTSEQRDWAERRHRYLFKALEKRNGGSEYSASPGMRKEPISCLLQSSISDFNLNPPNRSTSISTSILRQFRRQHPLQNAVRSGAGAFDVNADQGSFAEVDHGVSGAEQMGDGR